MNILLDTHVWVWSQVDADQLGPISLAELADERNKLFVSTVSTMEIARLVQQDLFSLQISMDHWVRESLAALQCNSLELSHEAAIEAYNLPGSFHKDPADRMLVATARTQNLTLITADTKILAYTGVRTLDARQ